MECRGRNVSVQNKLIGSSTSVGLWEQRKCHATMWVECLEQFAQEKRRMVTSTQSGGVRDPSVRSTRTEARGECSSRLLETS